MSARSALRTARFCATLVTLALVGVPLGAQAPDNTTPPVLAPPARLSVPTVHATTPPNGVHLEAVELHELPLVQVTALVTGGSRLDGKHSGIASFVATMLKEGAGSRDGVALQSELAFLGASLQTNTDWDRTRVSLKVPLRSLDAALDLMADVIRRPTFTAAEVRRQRDLLLTTLLQRRDQPNVLADLAFNQVVFPAPHPYHASAAGDSATVAALDSTALRTFYDRSVRPERTTFIVVGDITSATAHAALLRRFGDWHAAGVPSPEAIPSTQPLHQASTHLYLVDKPNAAQSVITIGWPGVDRHSPDYAALMVMNSLLGGSFTSRLNMNLREAKGYTYGAGSQFAFRRAPGPFTATAAVRTNVTDSSLVEFFKELRAVRDKPVPADELQRAKSYVELGLPEELESTTQVATQIAQLANFGLPLEELSRFAIRVRAITPDDIQRVARQYLTPDRATVVVVGDMAKVRAPVEALRLGKISVLNVRDVAK